MSWKALERAQFFSCHAFVTTFKGQSFKNGLTVYVTLSCYLICFCLKILPNQSVSLGLPDGAYTEKLFLNSNISMATFKKLYCYWEHLLGPGESIW